MRMFRHLFLVLSVFVLAAGNVEAAQFHLQETSIDQIQQAFRAGQITTTGLVELYL